MKRLWLIAFLVGLTTTTVSAQDLNLTQFYLTPAYLNPAFAGTTPEFRLAFHHRSQWNALETTPQRQFASFEYNFITFDGGMSLTAGRTTLGGDARWQTFEARGAYSQRVYLNYRWIIGAGLELAYVTGSLNQGDLIFEDQLLSGNATRETLPAERSSYVDANFGLTIYNKAFYAGLAVRNLTTPSLNAFGAEQNELERVFLVQIGYKAELPFKNYITPAALFRYQNSFYQLDLGANWENEYVFTGLWYRGVPFLSGGVENSVNQDAISLTAGAHLGAMTTVAFSYDINIADYNTLGNSFELSLLIAPKKNRTGRVGTHDILCPITL
ncbi:MAG: PorP/SprF family type IX secretion system membrane protein [Bacteroidota bacterium]